MDRLYIKNQANVQIPVTLCQEIGLNQAICLLVIDQLLAEAGAPKARLSIRRLQRLLPFWSTSTINRILHALQDMRLIRMDADTAEERWVSLNPEGFAHISSVLLVDETDILSNTRDNNLALANRTTPIHPNGSSTIANRAKIAWATAPDTPLFNIATPEEWLDEMRINDPARARILATTDAQSIVAWILWAIKQEWSTNPAGLVIVSCLQRRTIPKPFQDIATITLRQWDTFAHSPAHLDENEMSLYLAWRSVYGPRPVKLPWGLLSLGEGDQP